VCGNECPEMSALQNEQSPKLSFTKASACGNDFLLVEASHAPGDVRALTRRLCDRHNGIGADGVEWLFPDAEADIDARLINADGSAAEISGNGTRCVAAEICAREGNAEVVIRTGAGLKTCQFVRRRGSTFEFEANMGQPEVGGELSIETTSVRAIGREVSMGNPHFVIFVEDFPEGWQRQAALIQTQPQFPKERMWCMRRCAVPTKSRSVCLSGERRDPVLGHRIMRVRSRRNCQWSHLLAGNGDCAGRLASGALADGRVSARSGNSDLPRRILRLRSECQDFSEFLFRAKRGICNSPGKMLKMASATQNPRIKPRALRPAIRLASLRPPRT